MTIQECYKAIGADYDDVLGRLRSERLIQKFVLKFLDDESFRLLCDSMAAGDLDTAFRASHTIKGVCANLGFTRLGASSHDLTEALRGRDGAAAAGLLDRVKADYEQTAAAIRAYKAEAGL